MGKYEFKVAVTSVELSEEQQRRVGQAVAQAGAFAIGEMTSRTAISVPLALHHWWCGTPPPEIAKEIQAVARQQGVS
jgi:hypothetical protein